jgi:hypothetical protein
MYFSMNKIEIIMEENSEDERFKTSLSSRWENDNTMQLIMKKIDEQFVGWRPSMEQVIYDLGIFLCQWWIKGWCQGVTSLVLYFVS